MHLLAQIIAVIYILFGLFSLLVVSFPSNRQEMFWETERPWLGWLRVGHAIFTVLALVACGLVVLFGPPRIATGLAWVTLIAILGGKAIGLIFGERHSSCKHCMLIGSLVALVTTLVIVSGV